ncbi:hypothetical protein GE061_006927 [Apolygus lucorum]|uniref:Uncharacterized protein n=1 Tax=Apolygus lucorum TaxID=248454 RepID=A0A6A4JJP7_APOLU|nr:hypothetical protein GE061_006927 [Apolygus lucorum]
MDDIAPLELVPSPSSPREASVKSNAVVKYSLVESPVLYAPLRHNTDIKLPPENWLSSSAASRGLKNDTTRPVSSGFSSFRMANMFPESMGEVDVVSDAENIKKLLKIPYSSKSVSMVVHRVENTLLIDEFDIHKHLLSRAEDEWAWLRQYFVEHILSTLSTKDKALPYHDKSRTTLQQKALVSKFLHYSLAETEEKRESKVEQAVKSNDRSTTLPLATRGLQLPEPQLEQGIPCSDEEDHKFTRNVLWTFEDIQMLLGTDMPIFGGPSRPCISLRLRDAKRPISVLTGIDYWLDNLMSNVPEVVMCYHLDGIVQKYELIKTEDLPNLKESRFSPNLIRDVAQNILSFLKANATKAGHTYWLFKGTNEDAVKLYDLTSLCSDTMRDKEQNPFTVPVGMLLYRVARNMMATGTTPGQNNTLRTVLKNCISLLSKEKYPQIVTSAHYMLADLYIPFETDPSSPVLLSQSKHELSSIDDSEEVNEDDSAHVTMFSLNQTLTQRKPRNGKYNQSSLAKSGIEERCKHSLHHVCEGVDCLQYFDSMSAKSAKDGPEEEPKMANPFEPIPMPSVKPREKSRKKKKKDDKENSDLGETDGKSLKAVLWKPHGKTLPTWQRPEDMDNDTWKVYLCSLLTAKACLVYSILIEKEIDAKMYLLALKHIKGLLRCCGDNKPLASVMLSRAGDCFFNLSEQCIVSGEADLAIEDETDEYPAVTLPTPSYFEQDILLLECSMSMDELFEATINCYKRSLELCSSDDTKRRTGNACNMISSVYTTKASELLKAEDLDVSKFNKLIKMSEELLALGVKMFEAVGDVANSALLLSNTGRLYRIRGHIPFQPDCASLSPIMKLQYQKAVDCYTSALHKLATRKAAPGIWDVVYWELSTTLYTLATLNQDHPPAPSSSKSAEEIEREAVELIQKAIKYCDVGSNSFRQPLYQFRAASLYQRLGSLYFHSYRMNDFDDNKVKQIIQLCQINYCKSISLFSALENPLQVVHVQLERLSLFELVAEESKSTKAKIKNLQKALEICGECKSSLGQINEKNQTKDTSLGSSEVEKQDVEVEEAKLLQFLHEKLNAILLALIKLISSSDKNSVMIDTYKKVYVASLKRDKDSPLVSHLNQVLHLIPNTA